MEVQNVIILFIKLLYEGPLERILNSKTDLLADLK